MTPDTFVIIWALILIVVWVLLLVGWYRYHN
jgi:hypothetical protein